MPRAPAKPAPSPTHLEPQEGELLEYLASARDLAGAPLYDAVHALRLARDRGRLRASVALFCEVRVAGTGGAGQACDCVRTDL